MKPVKINHFEVWVADHAVPVFAVVSVLMVLGAGAFLIVYHQAGEAQREVDILKPQVTKIVRAASVCDTKTIKELKGARACSGRLRFALTACRHDPQCRAAILAIVNYPSPARGEGKEVVPQSPSSAGQQPGPGTQPGHQGHGGKPPKKPPKSPAPSPVPETPAPIAPQPAPPVDTAPGNSDEHSQGNGPPHTPPGQEKKGVEVDACVTTLCVEVGVDR
jgi:hypothetical protein